MSLVSQKKYEDLFAESIAIFHSISGAQNTVLKTIANLILGEVARYLKGEDNSDEPTSSLPVQARDLVLLALKLENSQLNLGNVKKVISDSL